MMPYDTYRLYEVERGKSPYEIQRADRQAALYFSAVSGLFRAIAQARSAVPRIRLPGLLRHAPTPGRGPAMGRRGSRRRHTAQTPAEPAGPRQPAGRAGHNAAEQARMYRSIRPPVVAAGVEEEFQIVDLATRQLTARAGEVMDQLPAGSFSAELQRSVLEANSRPWTRLTDLHAQAERDALGCIGPVRPVLRAGPVPAQGVAMVSQLVADGAGPLYRRASTEDLGDLIDEATRALTR